MADSFQKGISIEKLKKGILDRNHQKQLNTGNSGGEMGRQLCIQSNLTQHRNLFKIKQLNTLLIQLDLTTPKFTSLQWHTEWHTEWHTITAGIYRDGSTHRH